MLKKILNSFVITFLIIILSVNYSYSNNVKKSKWTVMVYMSGDNDLEEYIVKDLERELADIGSTNDVQILALADRTAGYDPSKGNWSSTKLFHVKKGLEAFPENALSDWGERNFGDPKTLEEFVLWSKKNYPAEKYALYFWGHGSGWYKGFTMRDITDDDSLDIDELKSVIPKIGFIDLIGYDGCNMASIEIDTLWYKNAKAIVHSQEYVNWDGIEYDFIIKELNKNPNMSAEKLAIITNKSSALNKEKTSSAIVLDKRFETLLKNINEWSISLKKNSDKNKFNYEKAFKKAQHFIDAPDEKDLYHLAKNISLYVKDPIIKEKSKLVMKSLKDVILDEWHVKEYPNAHGISISKISYKNRSFYKTTDFAKNTYWDEFLDSYNK